MHVQSIVFLLLVLFFENSVNSLMFTLRNNLIVPSSYSIPYSNTTKESKNDYKDVYDNNSLDDSDIYYYESLKQFKQLNLATKATLSGDDTTMFIKSNDSNYIIGISWSSVRDVLNIPSSHYHVFTPNLVVLGSGVASDINYLVEKMYDKYSNDKYIYDSDIPASRLSSFLSKYIYKYTLDTKYRPFGVKMCILGYNSLTGASLFEVDPFGNSFNSGVAVIGKYSDRFIDYCRSKKIILNKNSLQESIISGIDTIKNFIRFLREESISIDEVSDITMENVAISIIGKNIPYMYLKEDQIRKLVDRNDFDINECFT